MKNFKLTSFGNTQVLLPTNGGKKLNFKDFSELSDYIKKHSLENNIEGIEKIPDVYGLKKPFSWATATNEEKTQHVTRECQDGRSFADIAGEVLLQSGFTNNKLIE